MRIPAADNSNLWHMTRQSYGAYPYPYTGDKMCLPDLVEGLVGWGRNGERGASISPLVRIWRSSDCIAAGNF